MGVTDSVIGWREEKEREKGEEGDQGLAADWRLQTGGQSGGELKTTITIISGSLIGNYSALCLVLFSRYSIFQSYTTSCFEH